MIFVDAETEDNFWFVMFQCEEEIDENESYCTPWVGAKIAEVSTFVCIEFD